MTTMVGRELFAEFMRIHGVSRTQVAGALGVSRHTIHYWLREARPEPDHRLTIERWSRGFVPWWSWLTDEEIARIRAVAPLRGARPMKQRPPWERPGRRGPRSPDSTPPAPEHIPRTGTDG